VLQRLAVEVWQATRYWESANIYESLDVMRLKCGQQVIEGARGMSDGVEDRMVECHDSGRASIDARMLSS